MEPKIETKNLFLAIALSVVVFVVYLVFFVKPQQPTAPQVSETPKQEKVQVKQEPPKKVESPSPAPASIKTAKGKEIIVETDLLKAIINTAGGVITSWELKDYREADKSDVGLTAIYRQVMGQARKEIKTKKELGNVLLTPDRTLIDTKDMVYPLTVLPLDKTRFSTSQFVYRANVENTVRLSKEKPTETIVLIYQGPAGIIIEKSLTFYNADYKVDVGIKTAGIDGYTLSLGTDFGLADKVSSEASDRVGISAQTDGKLVSEKIEKIKGEQQYTGIIDWFGHEDKYFTATILYGKKGNITSKKTTAPPEIGDLITTDLTIKDKPDVQTFTLFAGPKSFSLLAAQGHGLEQLVDYGWFSILAKPMFWLMQRFYDFTKNYGIAIILLTIVVRVLLFYPSLKSSLSMEEMKKIQPLMAAVKEQYKKDPKRMNQEMMKLYKDHKVNPLSGCLPMLLQFPFFIALYNVLAVSIELRQAPFIAFWIKDLSAYDPYYILPLLMGLSMIVMMKMTATSDPQQTKIMMIMNVAFIIFFAWLPAGLLLYITISNILSIVQQMYVHRIITKREAAA